MSEHGTAGPLVAVEQAILSGITVAGGSAPIHRREPAARPVSEGRYTADVDIPISLAAYERAFEAKVRWEAGYFADSEQLDFPPRYQVSDDGSLSTRYELVPLPRTGTVYTETTVHIPVPGLRTPYSLVIVRQSLLQLVLHRRSAPFPRRRGSKRASSRLSMFGV